MKHLQFLKKILLLIVVIFLFDFLLSLVFLKGLNKYSGFDCQAEILINGSSMAESGFNRKDLEMLTGKKIAKYTLEGVSVFDRYEMIEHFFQMFPEEVENVIYEISPVIFSDHISAENTYTHFFPFMDDDLINKFIRDNAKSKEYYFNKIIRTKRYNSRIINKSLKGYLGNYGNLKTNTIDTVTLNEYYKNVEKTEIRIIDENVEAFEKTMALITSHNSSAILVMMPIYYHKLNSFQKEEYNDLIGYFENYSSKKGHISFLNLNTDSLITDAGLFSDPLHLNVYGQQSITNIICSYLDSN